MATTPTPIESMTSEQITEFAKSGVAPTAATPTVPAVPAADPVVPVVPTADPAPAIDPVASQDPAKPAEVKPAEAKPEVKPEPVSERKLNRTVAQREYQRGRADRAENENAQLRRQLDEMRTRPAAVPAVEQPAPRPTLDKFNSVEEYEAELLKWGVAEAERQKKPVEAKPVDKPAEVPTDQRQRMENWNRRVQTAEQNHPDFKSVVFTDKAIYNQTTMNEIVTNEEQGLELAHYLASHPDDMNRIAALNARQTVKALDEIIAKLPAVVHDDDGLDGSRNYDVPSGATPKADARAAAAANIPEVSGAPDPVRPLNGSGNGTGVLDPIKNFTEWSRAENDRERKKRQNR